MYAVKNTTSTTNHGVCMFIESARSKGGDARDKVVRLAYAVVPRRYCSRRAAILSSSSNNNRAAPLHSISLRFSTDVVGSSSSRQQQQQHLDHDGREPDFETK